MKRGRNTSKRIVATMFAVWAMLGGNQTFAADSNLEEFNLE